MTDELDALRQALKAAPPTPEPAAKAAALARAMENFDAAPKAAQGSAMPPRPISDRPARAGFLTGVREMLMNLTPRPALAATASVVAIAVALTVYPTLKRAPVPAPTPVAEEKAAETPAAVGALAKDEGRAKIGTEQNAPVADALPQVAPEPAPMAEAEADYAAGAAATITAESFAVAEEAAKSESATNYSTAVPASPPAPSARLAPTLTDALAAPPEPNTEAFANADQNPVKVTAEEPVSTFSTDVDTASWAVVRSSVENGYLPPAEAVRIEEMVNYFPYSYPAPDAEGAPFRTSVSLFQTPWNKDTRLLRIGLQGRLPAVADRPALDLVFLIDTSGSMEDSNKLPLLIQSFRLMLGQLRPEDRVAIVTYAGSAGLVLEPTEAKDRATIEAALGRLNAGGSTAGAEGLELAYRTAEAMTGEGHVRRIILATDGDFNVGVSDPEGLEAYVARKRATGTYLSVLGFGRGNLDDAVMQSLAQNGNGTAAYIDTLAEAQKVLVDQLSGALFPIADDVKVQVEFNPAAVAEYRLIGYETRKLAREDFNNDKVDAGEIGAGLQVTALYEVTPVGSPALRNDPLRYGEPSLAT